MSQWGQFKLLHDVNVSVEILGDCFQISDTHASIFLKLNIMLS